MADIIAVAKPCNGNSFDAAALLLPSLYVGKQLTGVEPIAQPVDHRHQRILRDRLDDRMRTGAHHNDVHHAGQHSGRNRRLVRRASAANRPEIENKALPPKWLAATSKDTRVRVDDFSNTSAKVRFCISCGHERDERHCAFNSISACGTILRSCEGDKSLSDKKCCIIPRPAASNFYRRIECENPDETGLSHG